MPITPLTSFDLDVIVTRALEEDISHGDITTQILIPSEVNIRATIIAKQVLTVAGIPVLQKVFKNIDPLVLIHIECKDGTHTKPGQVIATLQGQAQSILTGERVALNFLQHLSGIATLTKQFCEAISEYPAKILDTRKTTPGLRALEKWAVTCGGGTNHRRSLHDGILIKDNHLALLNAQGISITLACRMAKTNAPDGFRVCVEIESLDDIEQALAGKADVLLLDNMTPELVHQAVAQIKGRAIIEVSGGINLSNVREFAATGAGYISIGALTHSAPAVDISLDIQPGPIT